MGNACNGFHYRWILLHVFSIQNKHTKTHTHTHEINFSSENIENHDYLEILLSVFIRLWLTTLLNKVYCVRVVWRANVHSTPDQMLLVYTKYITIARRRRRLLILMPAFNATRSPYTIDYTFSVIQQWNVLTKIARECARCNQQKKEKQIFLSLLALTPVLPSSRDLIWFPFHFSLRKVTMLQFFSFGLHFPLSTTNDLYREWVCVCVVRSMLLVASK